MKGKFVLDISNEGFKDLVEIILVIVTSVCVVLLTVCDVLFEAFFKSFGILS